MTLITCITTVFNDGPVLLTGITSVLNQSHGDLQYIIVDDGSTDAETRDLLAGIDDPRVLLIPQANDGLSGARNKALEQARGEYVCFLDADDARPGWALAAMLEQARAEEADLVLARGVLSESRDELLPFYDSGIFDLFAARGITAVAQDDGSEAGRLALALAHLIEPQAANKLIARPLLEAWRIRFPDTHFYEDIFFHTEAVACARRIAFLQAPAFAYFRRYGRPQITSGAGERRFDILPVTRMTLDLFRERPGFADPLRRAAVAAGCLKIVEWCGASIAHNYRWEFRRAAKAVLALVDPGYLHLPAAPPEEMAQIRAAGAYMAGLLND